MPIQISLKKSTTDPNGASGLTLGEPVFNYSNKTFWMGLGGSTAPVWIGAGICGASAAIASGTAYTIPTVGSVRDYFIGVSGSFLPSTTGYVSSFNGRTGAVQGVSSAAAGTGISISAATGAITITNTGVQTFNGLTGAVTGVTTSAANTFTALNSFNAGISAAGITVGSKLFLGEGPSGWAQIKALPDDSTGGMLLYMPWGRIGDINNHYGNGLQIGVWGDEARIIMGDIDGAANGTTVEINDGNGTITLSGAVNNTTSISSPKYFDDYSSIRTYQTTTSATTANQTIATVAGVYDSGQIPEVMGYPAFEVTISARDTVLNKTEMLKMLVVQNGTDTVNTQYGLIRTGLTGPVESYSTTLQNTAGVKDLLIRATPSSANSTKFNVTVRAHNA